MRSLVLDATNKSITVVMSAAAATTNPDYTTHWADDTGTTFTEGASDGTLSGTTPVTVVASPAASTRRVIKDIIITNVDTAAVTITVKYVNNASSRVLFKQTIQPNETFTIYGTLTNTGSLKYKVETGNFGITYVIDGGGVLITTGVKGYLEIPFDFTAQRLTMLANESGSIVVHVKKCAYSGFPGSLASIYASAPPTISSSTNSQDGTLTGWTTAWNAGDILEFTVNSVTNIKLVTLSFKGIKT